MEEKVKYRINENLYIQHVSSDELGIFDVATNKKVLGANEDSARRLVNILASFLPCEHQWIDVPDFDNDSFVKDLGMRMPGVNTVCKKCHINKP